MFKIFLPFLLLLTPVFGQTKIPVLDSSGNLVLGTPSSAGATTGAINAQGGFYENGVKIGGSAVLTPHTNAPAYWNGTALVGAATGGAGTLCFVSTDGGVPVFGSCSGSAATAWDSLTNPSTNLALTMGANTSTFTTGTGTSTANLWTWQDTTANTGTGYLASFNTVGTSTLKPWRTCAKGTTNCITFASTGVMSAAGTATIQATTISGALTLANTPLTTRGDILVVNQTPDLVRLPLGSIYQTLQGGVADPLWGAVHLDQSAAVTGALAVANGGSGLSTKTAHALYVGNTTSPDAALSVGGTDTVLMGSTGANPAFAAVTNCGDSTHAVSYNTTTHAWGCQSITAGGTTPLVTGTTVSLSGPREYAICTGTCTVTPPVPVAGYEFCVRNANNVSTVITLGALGSSARYEATDNTGYGTAGTGTMVSTGTAGDKVCIVGLDSTHYLVMSSSGSWTSN